jgi:hypothetical protein
VFETSARHANADTGGLSRAGERIGAFTRFDNSALRVQVSGRSRAWLVSWVGIVATATIDALR